jgi:hypothetical protein
LIDPNLGIHLNSATDINERGQILAFSYTNTPDFLHTYLLTPANISVPDQGSTIMLFGLSVLALVTMVRFRVRCL